MKLVLYMYDTDQRFSKRFLQEFEFCSLSKIHYLTPMESKRKLCSKLSHISRKALDTSENDISLKMISKYKIDICSASEQFGALLLFVFIFLLALHKPSENHICSKIGAQSSARRQFGANLGGEGQKLPSGAKLPSWGRRSL